VVSLPLVSMSLRAAWSSTDLGRNDGRNDGLPEGFEGGPTFTSVGDNVGHDQTSFGVGARARASYTRSGRG
jgi:hypothetical protein